MEIHNTRKVTKEVEETVDKFRVCDKCNARIEKDNFNAFDFTLELRDGCIYPEYGDGDIRRIDLCQNCSENLLEKLEKEGYRINKRKWEY